MKRTGTWPPPCSIPGCSETRRANSDVCVAHHMQRAERKAEAYDRIVSGRVQVRVLP